METVATCSSLQPGNLPPTERAINFHALRVYLQLCQWKTLDLHCLNPLEWGWYKAPDGLKPVKTDMEPAPEFLLKFIRCKCSTKTKNSCGTNVCTCRRNGLKCVAACGHCHGEDCCNVAEFHVEDIEDGDDPLNDDDEFDQNIFDLFD